MATELQRGETVHTLDHLAHGVPDLRVETLAERFEELVRRDLPLAEEEVGRLRGFASRVGEFCRELG